MELADEAVVHVPGAGSQAEWCRNRRAFDVSRGVQREYVVEDDETADIVGYGSVEAAGDEEFRLFVVTPPDRLSSVGALLYTTGIETLRELGARAVTFSEYAADEPIVSFAISHGFKESRRWTLPDGKKAITLRKDL